MDQSLWRSSAATVTEDPGVVRRRRITVVVVLLAGAALQGYSLSRPPGDTSFYWLTLGLAVVWTVGALASGPLRLGSERRPVLIGVVTGLVLSAAFVVGGLVVREITLVREYVTAVLEFADQGALALIVFITVINGIAEELFFRGALYTALGSHHPEVLSTVVYVGAVMAAGNPMLGFAGILLGGVCAWQRRVTGGVLAPVLTHFLWGLTMVLVLPPIFGV